MQRLSSDALGLILQYLTARYKLTVIACLSRAFHPLPALAFVRDSISSWLPIASSDESDRTHQLRSLFLTVQQGELPGRYTLFTCPRSLRYLPQSAGLQELYVCMALTADADWAASLRSILRSVLSLPSLQRLCIDCSGGQLDLEADWTDAALPEPALLRHLTLTRLSLSAASILRLCCLSLESLQLDCCVVLADSGDAVISAEQTAGSGSSTIVTSSSSSSGGISLKTLSLPYPALQLYVKAAQHSGCRLEQLRCCGPLSHELLDLIVSHAQLQQLRELDFWWSNVDLRSGPPLDLSPLMTASGAPRLSQLSRLTLPLRGILCDCVGYCNPELEQAFLTASQQLIAAYAAQLTSLSVTVLSASTLSAWFQFLFARCGHIEVLSVVRHRCVKREPPLELQMEPEAAGAVLTLGGVKELRLGWLPLTDGGLLSLFSRCPQLCKHWLCELPHVTSAGKEAAFRCCPKLAS